MTLVFRTGTNEFKMFKMYMLYRLYVYNLYIRSPSPQNIQLSYSSDEASKYILNSSILSNNNSD